MTEEIIIDAVDVAGCEHLYGDNCCDDTKLSSIDCAKNNCKYKEFKHLQRENKEKIDIIEQMIKILYPNASDDELYDVAFNGEYIDKLKELKDTADTMLMVNDIKKQDIDSLREANERLEQENKALNFKINQLKANCLYNDLTGIELSAKVVELEQENKELEEKLNAFVEHSKTESDKVYYKMLDYKTALEDIRNYCDRIEQGSVIGTQDCLINSIKNITNEVLGDN